MQYTFRDASFDGKTIRFIKPINFNSDGYEDTNLDIFRLVQRQIELQEPNTRVVVMLGYSNTMSRQDDFMTRFLASYRRLPDEYYTWHTANFIS